MSKAETVRTGKLGKADLRLVRKNGRLFGLADGKVCVEARMPTRSGSAFTTKPARQTRSTSASMVRVHGFWLLPERLQLGGLHERRTRL
jgi:hypothetical protein